MPNWKSYESSVRLLSAIIAAHPTLRLNYDETSKLYGRSANYKAIWHRMRQINENAKALREAYDSGKDPEAVELNDGVVRGPTKTKAQALSKAFGGDCTKYAIENRFRRIKSDAKLITEALSNGIDPITINVGDAEREVTVKGSKNGQEIQAHFGEDVTASALRWQFAVPIKADVKRLREARAAGTDCQTVTLGGSGGNARDEMSKYFGTDSTAGGIEFQFRSIKINAKRQKACAASGGDPKTLGIGGGNGGDSRPKAGHSPSIATYYPDGSADSLQHRFRPIIKEANNLRKTTAQQYGQGITGKAVSTRFERMRKEEPWNLNINREADAAPKSTPRKRAPKANGSGKKGATTQNFQNGSGDSDDDEGSTFDPTPSKKSKGTLNKVKSGRVGKQRAHNGLAPGAYAEHDDEDDEEDDMAVKDEDEYGNMLQSTGYEDDDNGFSGHHHQQMMDYGNGEGDDQYYDVDEA